MTETTLLDSAHAAMVAAPDDDAARLGFYERLAGCELFLMLAAQPEASAESVTPEIFDLDGARYVLAFDREERLARFAGRPAPFVALSGQAIAEMLAEEELGLGVNLDVAPSAILLPDTAIRWLHDTLRNRPDEVEARIRELHAPTGLPDRFVAAIDRRLAAAAGLADCAWLARVVRGDGRHGHLLAFVDALPDAQGALARTIADALTFSGIEEGEIDVGFVRSQDPIVERLSRVGLRFDLPRPGSDRQHRSAAPGSDPSKPPILK